MQKPTRLLGLAATLIGAVLLCRCDMQTAGSSVGTGNPTEIRLGFTGGDGAPRALTGKVDVYAATQIPLAGFHPEPLASFAAEAATSVTINADALKSVPDSLWPAASREGDSVFRFNVVVTGDKVGAILQGLRYRVKDGEFSRIDSVMKAGAAADVAEMSSQLAATADYSFFIDPKPFPLGKDTYVFISGTGFVAKSDSGTFLLKSLPGGKYDPSLIFLAQPGQGQTGQQDSVQLYGLSAPLNTTAVDSLAVGGPKGSVPLPALYKN